ncbi:aldo/keto reductase [Zhihengliuella sp. ISTPL4]|uniref:aldo/keto reductase n=1 Tax=Zhihengliuella sp. ISTPL4 TaxID=2058657 RepID=UPI000C7A125E|nr:aldo/keto reductase [Zhihengliuella sp. ISTPL4]
MTPSLPTVPLGTTGMEITRVGLGAFAIGGPAWSYGWGAQDDDDSIRTIRAAVDRGINWIDTAAVYGRGHSEVVVGRALRDLPQNERPWVFTKGGLVWSEDDALQTGERKVGDPASLRREVQDSLRRLQVEQIDLYQMHWPAEDGSEVEDYWGALVEMRDSGLLKAIGLSNHDVAQLDRAEAIGHVDTLQPPFSAIYRDAAADVLPWCAHHATGAIIYSPMQSGLLTGRITEERVAQLPADDWRSRHPDFSGDRLRQNLRVTAALAEVGERHGISTGAAAIAWALVFRGVSGAIVGARTPEQIDGWVNAGSVELTADDIASVARAIRDSGAGSGPDAPR